MPDASQLASNLPHVAVYGHFPPPVTGERLCCLHLIERLRSHGARVDACTKKTGLQSSTAAEIAWVILGSKPGGFIRDCLLVMRQRRPRRVFVYIHNASWRRVVRYRALLRPVFGRRSTFVVLTDTIDDAMHAAGWSSTVLRNTVTARELGGLAANPEAHRLLWMSAITREKGFPDAYAAFETLRAEDKDWIFDVYGAGLPAENYPLARFHGVVQGPAKREAFSAGGIMVLPSNYANETQPLCLLEAMSVGLPVVTSAVGGIPEIVGLGADAAGRCLSTTGGAELAEAIAAVRLNGAHHGAQALKRFARLFSPEAFDRGLERIMEQSLGATFDRTSPASA